MARTYYFPQILRKTNIAFMSLFKNIRIAKYDVDNNITDYRDVPLVFGHKKKFITKMEREKQFNKYLPMMSVIITGINRNATKNRGGHLTELMKYFEGPSEELTNLYGGVPYSILYSLSIITQSLTEAEIIMEQILPQFTPYENITIKEFDFLPEFTRDIRVNLDDVTPDFIEEIEEGDIRRIEVEMNFTVDAWFYRPVLIGDIIKTVKAEFIDDTLSPAITGTHMATYTYQVSGNSDNYDVELDEWNESPN